MRTLTKEEFILKAREIHGWKYDYSEANYVNSRTKICIICPKHGKFFVTPNSHLAGVGCKKCSSETKSKKMLMNTTDFITEAQKKHGNKYDYSKVNYINSRTKVLIICPEHGEFLQSPSVHMRTCGCPYCGNENKSESKKMKKEDFINKANKIHNYKYDYSKIEYNGCKEKIKITCSIHGDFYQSPYMHLFGQGCPKCGNGSKNKDRTKTKEDFIKDAIKVHGDKYDYSNVEYINNHTKVKIICKKHGEFLQTPNRHLQGSGCPHCKQSKLELEIESFLIENKLIYEKWKKFDWLGKQSIDFYLKDYYIGIECQGIQHFSSSKNKKSFYTDEKIEIIKKRDELKRKLCNENGIKLLYYSNFKIDFPYDVITDKNKLLKEIEKCANKI